MVTDAPVVPPGLPSAELLIFLTQFALLLVMARMLGSAAQRLGMPRIVGELSVGVLLGPSLLGWVAPSWHDWLFPAGAEQYHLLDIVGTIGMLLLVGLTAIELDMKMFRRRAADAARISIGGMAVPFAAGIGLGYALPAALLIDGENRLTIALFIGIALSVSAIPVISKTLTDMNLLHRNVGQLVLAAGFIDDTVAWFLLSITAGLAGVGVIEGSLLLKTAAVTIGFILLAATLGRVLVNGSLRLASRRSGSGGTVSVLVAAIFICAAASQALGLEPVLGAFLAGLLIARSRHSSRKGSKILGSVTHSVLAPVFFATVGLRVDLTALADPVVLGWGCAVLAVAILGKIVGVYIGARASRLSRWESLALGSGMNARGAVEIVVASVGVRLGVLTPQMYTIVVAIAVITSLIAPPLLRLTMSRVASTIEEDERLGRSARPLEPATRSSTAAGTTPPRQNGGQ